MTPTSPDPLDRLLTDFFQAQLPRPWPPAPVPAPLSSPATAMAGGIPGRTPPARPTAAASDPLARARYTLAVSVALLLGTCVYLSAGLPEADRRGRPVHGTAPPDVWSATTARDPAALKQLRKDAAEAGIVPPMTGFTID